MGSDKEQTQHVNVLPPGFGWLVFQSFRCYPILTGYPKNHPPLFGMLLLNGLPPKTKHEGKFASFLGAAFQAGACIPNEDSLEPYSQNNPTAVA